MDVITITPYREDDPRCTYPGCPARFSAAVKHEADRFGSTGWYVPTPQPRRRTCPKHEHKVAD